MDFSVVGEVPAACHGDWRSEALEVPRSVSLVSVVALSPHTGPVVQHRVMKSAEASSWVEYPLGGLEAGYLLGTGIGDAGSDP